MWTFHVCSLNLLLYPVSSTSDNLPFQSHHLQCIWRHLYTFFIVFYLSSIRSYQKISNTLADRTENFNPSCPLDSQITTTVLNLSGEIWKSWKWKTHNEQTHQVADDFDVTTSCVSQDLSLSWIVFSGQAGWLWLCDSALFQVSENIKMQETSRNYMNISEGMEKLWTYTYIYIYALLNHICNWKELGTRQKHQHDQITQKNEQPNLPTSQQKVKSLHHKSPKKETVHQLKFYQLKLMLLWIWVWLVLFVRPINRIGTCLKHSFTVNVKVKNSFQDHKN